MLTDGEFKSGQTVAHYKIVSLIGEGGMGRVYLAEDAKLHRKVSLKFLSTNFTQDHERLRRFEQEARAVSALNHPNILTIYEIGEADGRRFIATEFIEGQTLRERMLSGVDIDEALDFAIQAASALVAAHRVNIVHRDIKPENIMIRREDGLVKVLDFGLAKLSVPRAVASGSIDREAETRMRVQTQPGVVMGTVAYMSPEQGRGDTVDERTDIWSLGVVLYEMIAGCSPFVAGTSNEIISAILSKEPAPPLARYSRLIPERLQEIVEKALTKNRDERYQTSKDLLIDLKRLKQSLETKAAVERSASPDKLGVPSSGGKSNDAKSLPLKVATPNTQSASSAEYIVNQVKSHKHGVMITFAVLLLAVASGVLIYAWRLRQTAAPIQPEIKSLAVLPLNNLSGDPAQEYFADGITEALISNLAQIRALRVISRTSAMRYKGTNKSLPEIARELNVDAVIEGSVQRSGGRVHVRAQLIHAASDSHLWAAEYDRDLRDVLALESEVARTIASEVRIKITPAEQRLLAPKRVIAREAIYDYLQGRYYLNRRTEQNLRKAIKFFEGAIQADPNYAQAYAGLADCYNQLGTAMIGVLPPSEARRTAETAARKALEIDNDVAEAHAALGYVNYFNWNWTTAEEEFKRAIELNPNYASAHSQYAHYLVCRGDRKSVV